MVLTRPRRAEAIFVYKQMVRVERVILQGMRCVQVALGNADKRYSGITLFVGQMVITQRAAMGLHLAESHNVQALLRVKVLQITVQLHLPIMPVVRRGQRAMGLCSAENPVVKQGVGEIIPLTMGRRYLPTMPLVQAIVTAPYLAVILLVRVLAVIVALFLR